MAMNPCPCGNLGRSKAACFCSALEISRYWRKLGGALLDRVDLRIPLEPVRFDEMSGDAADGQNSAAIGRRVAAAIRIQRERYKGLPFNRNAHIAPGLVDRFCALDREGRVKLQEAAETLSLSSRAFHSILKVARTVADLDDSRDILKDHLLEAVQYRRYCEGDVYWNYK
jgi:magnesium chelatase family protein